LPDAASDAATAASTGSAARAAEAEADADADAGRRWPESLPWRFWRSPADQPRWARPALLIVTALAGLAYAWRFDQAYLEPFYGGAARSMAMNLHNFVYGAADPWGTVSVDKLPGALWFQALSLRIFGFHVWALVLPQVVEGMLTVLVLYRAVRRVAGAGAGLAAAVVLAGSPVVILLDRGNISDSLLILLLVLAADATIRACQTGRLRSLLWAGALVGFAFQAKMLQAWIVLPALFLAYLVAAPALSFLRRVWHVATATLVVAVVSLSYMSAVSAVPQQSRPYVDGSCNDSLFNQVFSYNGFTRLGSTFAHQVGGCSRTSTWLINLGAYANRSGAGTGGIGASWDRLLQGPFGHDAAWLLLPTVVAAVWLFVLRRRTPRTDIQRAALILWSVWLVVTFGFFSGGEFLNSYYLAALIPPVAALCGMGALAAWQRRRIPSVRVALIALTVATVAVTVALVPGYVGVRTSIIGSTMVVGLLAVVVLAGSLRAGHDSVWAVSVGPALAVVAMLLGTLWASGIVVAAQLSPFDSPYAPALVNTYTRSAATQFPADQKELATFVQDIPSDRAADVFETSRSTGFYVLATGHEFLPVGGFSGRVPAPSLAAFIELVAQARVERVTVTTKPLTNAPDLRWVASHCRQYGASVYDPEERAYRSVFYCAPSDASGPAHGAAHGHATHAVSPVPAPPQPVGNRGTASPA
jgi:4-amino-4-deoxy-L-arabinose transferase-like glycosyltransferase